MPLPADLASVAALILYQRDESRRFMKSFMGRGHVTVARMPHVVTMNGGVGWAGP